MFEQDMAVSGDSTTVPLTIQRSNDAYALYLRPETKTAGPTPAG